MNFTGLCEKYIFFNRKMFSVVRQKLHLILGIIFKLISSALGGSNSPLRENVMSEIKATICRLLSLRLKDLKGALFNLLKKEQLLRLNTLGTFYFYYPIFFFIYLAVRLVEPPALP